MSIETCIQCSCEIQEDWPVTLIEFENFFQLGPLCEDCKDVALKAGYHFEIDTNRIKDEMALVEWGKIIFGPDKNGRKFVTDMVIDAMKSIYRPGKIDRLLYFLFRKQFRFHKILESAYPKEVMKMAGKIWAYVVLCEADTYWSEQVWYGERDAIDKAKHELERNANKN